MISNKAIGDFDWRGHEKYWTRKDYHHLYHNYRKDGCGYIYAFCNAKWYRKQANRTVRRYKGEISNGGSYKKIYDIGWRIL